MGIIENLVGKKLLAYRGGVGDDALHLLFDSAEKVLLNHSQDCCESVTLTDITGDMNDLVGETLLFAEETVDSKQDTESYDSVTYTFYRFRTHKGSVDIRWTGSSNGYYSESVDVELVKMTMEEYLNAVENDVW